MSQIDHLDLSDLDPRAQKVLESCEPYLVTYPGNLEALDRSPFGHAIDAEHTYDPTRLRSRRVIDGLHHLDAFSFGDQDMLMPRWVLFDCGEFPGIVSGFGRKAKDCADDVREAYKVTSSGDDDVFVPLSMWVGIRCAEEGAWFGHNLSSANLIAKKEPLPGLATLTKGFAVKVAKASIQYGATQWDSSSLNIHLSLGTMQLLNALTPAHTHIESFTYRIETNDEALTAALRPGYRSPQGDGDRAVVAGDRAGIEKLQHDIEAGARYSLHRIERKPGAKEGEQTVWLNNA